MSQWNAAIEAAAKYVAKLQEEYAVEYGSYDPDTGFTEFSQAGEEYMGTLAEIEEGIRALKRPEAPDGWKLVPMKSDGRAGLSDEMCRAFWKAYFYAQHYHGHFEATNAGYNAMLAAAPTPPKEMK